MCDVDRNNFADIFPKIEDAIRTCDFIAFDTEFTTLVAGEENKGSLFDDMEARYKKCRSNMTKAAICQLGLSIFHKDPKDCSRYEAKTFNFYLCPQSLGLLEPTFTCQASSLEFLVRYKFDFNKFIYTGISYMNETQEQRIMNQLNANKMFSDLERSIDEEALSEICSKVADWIINSEESEGMELRKDGLNDIPPFLVRQELLSRFPHISVDLRKEVIQIAKKSKDSEENKNSEIKLNKNKSANEVLDRMLGFTQVFRVMKECKKPLVGHNMFLDLLLMYDKFHKPLPVKYSDFKREIHQLFPVIFDTKHITADIRRPLDYTGLFQKTALEKLYTELYRPGGLGDVVIHYPSILHNGEFGKYSIEDMNIPHEAGWDAYMCGYVFLRTTHIITFIDIRSGDVSPCTFQRYLSSMSKYANNINIIRAYLNNINLAGPDPISQRPDLLYLTHRKMWQTIDVEQVAKLMSSYGSVDVRPLGKSRALIAAGNFSCAKDILKGFKKNKLYYVTKYVPWKHSYIAQGLLWSGLLVSGGVCAWALLSDNKKQ